MILDFYGENMDGNGWEKLCQSCYRIRYQNQHYTEIPAVHGGDAGIEGFTCEGIVIQCYYPERNYTDNELYEHLRNKMTADISKLLNKDYKSKLMKLGVHQIHEWHFVIPLYKDSRIIEHATAKGKEVLERKKNEATLYDYIADDFKIVIKQAEDFKFEITRIIRDSLTNTKLNLAIYQTDTIDWSKCDSVKVENIKRKVKAVSDYNEGDDNFKNIVDIYIKSYIKGLELLNMLRLSYTEIYEDVNMLEQVYKKQVSIQTMMNTDKSLNLQIFNSILDDFGKKLNETCKYFTSASIIELKIDIISMWLADCSMQFGR